MPRQVVEGFLESLRARRDSGVLGMNGIARQDFELGPGPISGWEPKNAIHCNLDWNRYSQGGNQSAKEKVQKFLFKTKNGTLTIYPRPKKSINRSRSPIVWAVNEVTVNSMLRLEAVGGPAWLASTKPRPEWTPSDPFQASATFVLVRYANPTELRRLVRLCCGLDGSVTYK